MARFYLRIGSSVRRGVRANIRASMVSRMAASKENE